MDLRPTLIALVAACASTSQVSTNRPEAPSAPAPAPVASPARPPVTITLPTDARCADYVLEAGPMNFDPPEHVGAVPSHAYRLDSGLATCVIVASSGERVGGENDRVTLHYSGWTADGRRIDGTKEEGAPELLPPLYVFIEGFTEAVQMMRVGERRRFWIPQGLAYHGRAGFPEGTLIYDVELLDFESMPEPTPPPLDVAEPPATATATDSGLHWRTLEAGTGTAHPSETSRVTVHYTGWRTNGEVFDRSGGTPRTFPLSQVIEGWSEGVRLMVTGEKRRLWIPPELAYEGQRGPQGMLVYDVELIAIE